jgi:hypothetical protein
MRKATKTGSWTILIAATCKELLKVNSGNFHCCVVNSSGIGAKLKWQAAVLSGFKTFL